MLNAEPRGTLNILQLHLTELDNTIKNLALHHTTK